MQCSYITPGVLTMQYSYILIKYCPPWSSHCEVFTCCPLGVLSMNCIYYILYLLCNVLIYLLSIVPPAVLTLECLPVCIVPLEYLLWSIHIYLLSIVPTGVLTVECLSVPLEYFLWIVYTCSEYCHPWSTCCGVSQPQMEPSENIYSLIHSFVHSFIHSFIIKRVVMK